MTNLLILSILVGAVLGMRFRVLILIPVMGFAIIAGIGAARGEAPSLIVTAMIFVAIALQLGFLVGSATRFILVASRISHRYKIPTPVRTAMAGDRPTISP
jgi:uncharacterized membrane protein